MNEEYVVDVEDLTIRFNLASEKVDNLKEYVIKIFNKCPRISCFKTR